MSRRKLKKTSDIDVDCQGISSTKAEFLKLMEIYESNTFKW